MRAAVLKAPNELILAEAPEPRAEPGDLVLRVRAATICGTDIRILRGRKTAGVRYPSIIGHEFAGEVVVGTLEFPVGTRVGVCPSIPCGHCAQCLHGRENLCPDQQAMGYHIDGAFAEFVRIPGRAVSTGHVHKLPDAMAFDEAALAEPLACVINGQNRIGLTQGDSVTVLGAGPIGLLHVQLARLRGAARVIVSEPSPQRREAALSFGADVVIDPTEADLRERVRQETWGLGADVVICAIGIPALAQQAIGLAGIGGRVSFFAGFSKGEKADLDINAIHYDELRITGSFGLSRLDFATALRILADRRIDARPMITHRYGLSDVSEAFAQAERGSAIKVAIANA